MQAILYNEDSKGSSFDYVDIPDDLKSEAEWRSKLVEEVASNDEVLMDKYLNEEEIQYDELLGAIRSGCLNGHYIPTLCGSAFKNKGVQKLFDAVCDLLPSP